MRTRNEVGTPPALQAYTDANTDPTSPFCGAENYYEDENGRVHPLL